VGKEPEGFAEPLRGRRKHRNPLASQRHVAFSMSTPFLILFAAFFILPLGYAIVKSIQSPRGVGLAGFGNFSIAIHTGAFWSSIVRVAYIGVIEIGLMLGFGMLLALLLDSPYCRGKRIFAVVYFLPYAVPGVIASIMWGFLLTPQLDSLVRSAKLNPLGTSTVLYSIILIVVWEFMGYNMTIYLTGLAQISPGVLEAAKIDGCSELQLVRYIKVPLLRRMVVFTAVLSIIGTLQLFNEPAIISALAPLGPTYTPNLGIYNEAFQDSNIPLAAAESLILAVVTIGATAAFYGLSRRRRGAARGDRDRSSGPRTPRSPADPTVSGRGRGRDALELSGS
jgi:multiple sugar transport system permease protein